MLQVRAVETYVRENLGDVVQEGRWRVVMSKELSRNHFQTMKRFDATHNLLRRQERTRDVEGAGGSASVATADNGGAGSRSAGGAAPQPLAADHGGIGALRKDVSDLKAVVTAMARGLDELKAGVRACSDAPLPPPRPAEAVDRGRAVAAVGGPRKASPAPRGASPAPAATSAATSAARRVMRSPGSAEVDVRVHL